MPEAGSGSLALQSTEKPKGSNCKDRGVHGAALWSFARLICALSGAGAHCCTLQDDAEAGDSKLEVLQSLRAQMEDVKVTARP